MYGRIAATTAVLVASCLLAAAPKAVETFAGKVIGVTDGDTVKVLVDKRPVTVRLEGIDAPERTQEYSAKATEALVKLVMGQQITVRTTGSRAVFAAGDVRQS